ncbi:hypothetical protein K9N68_22850 [Kovacikia minuta CCNUW1]|nr:hypothetical protein [Kovacikia minuta]UBF24510.1 hypothetical protein K9N68_22850 [Kovacikia minuta CCNUW1]
MLYAKGLLVVMSDKGFPAIDREALLGKNRSLKALGTQEPSTLGNA